MQLLKVRILKSGKKQLKGFPTLSLIKIKKPFPQTRMEINLGKKQNNGENPLLHLNLNDHFVFWAIQAK